ncbi:MAG TPA: M28 family peptidase [Phenylobacterium sp.]|nr:M28 family peptidase [Phenylobacterium sp.]
MPKLRAALAALLALGIAACATAPADVVDRAQATQDLRILSADDMQGRAVGTPGGAKARAYLLGRLKAIGVQPFGSSYEQPFSFTDKEGTANGVNLVGRIPGAGSSDKVLVIGAHYDHEGVKNGEIYNGADDNASGVAGLLAIAAAFIKSPPEHETVFVLFDAEERGLRGAQAFVDKPPVPLERMALLLNFDMLGRNAQNELWVAGPTRQPALKPVVEALVKEAAPPVVLKIGHDGPPWKGADDWTLLSDQGPFHTAGVPWLYIGVDYHPDYHKPTDDFERIAPAFFGGAVQTVVTAARKFDGLLDALPREKPLDFPAAK